jgi:hypothetical protein
MSLRLLSYFFVIFCPFMSLFADGVKIETFQGNEVYPYAEDIR